MKKLFYVVLVIVILMVISYFIKGGSQTETSLPAGTDVVAVGQDAGTGGVSVDAVDAAACNCDAKAVECVCPEGQPDCDCASEKAACNCQTSDGVEVIEEVDENIEEVNPEVTANDDETIVQE